jgi:spore coat polysaccharide biosynthesis protein SpsF (cytidylyltransferase family)
MSNNVGVLVFARYDSRRLPGKALLRLGGMPLLERVIRRAQITPLPVYLATTERSSDDVLVALADSLGVQSFRGSADRVLDRAVLAAEAFGLDAFVRLCGDRPLFPLGDLQRAVEVLSESDGAVADLITTYSPGVTARGLTTEVIRTDTLRKIMDRGVSAEQQEHVTPYFYDNPGEFRIVALPDPPTGFACPGFALDTEADLGHLARIFSVSDALGMTPAQAERIYLG